MKLRVGVVVGLLVIFSLFPLALLTTQNVAATIVSEHGFYVNLTVDGTTNGTQTNYPMRLVVNSGVGVNTAGVVYLNGHSLNWPYDIRFTKLDNTTELNFWRESYDANTMIVWVEVDSIAASPSSTSFNIHYSKYGETDASNGTNTFTFFETFGNATVDTTFWTVTGTTASTANSELTMTSTTTCTLRSKAAFGLNFGLTVKWKMASAQNAGSGFRNVGTDILRWYTNSALAKDLNQIYTGGALTTEWPHAYVHTANVYAVWNVSRISATKSIFTFDGQTWTNTTAGQPAGPINIQLEVGTGTGAVWDWVIVRPIADPEPTWGAVATEGVDSVPWMLSTPTYFGHVSTPYSYNATCSYSGANGAINWQLATNATWLTKGLNGTGFQVIGGTPLAVGSFYVNLSVNDSDSSQYNNYSLSIEDNPPTNYQFYDDFESGNLNLWNIRASGPPVFSMTHAYHGSYGLEFNTAGSFWDISRSFSSNPNPVNENVVVAVQFYDNAADTTANSQLYVWGPAGVIGLGVYHDWTNYYGYRYSTDSTNWTNPEVGTFCQVSQQRTTGWHSLKILALSHTMYTLYIDDIFVGNITTATTAGMSAFGYVQSQYYPIDCWIDEFSVYEFYQDTLWTRVSPTPAIQTNLTWKLGGVGEVSVMYEGGIWKAWHVGWPTSGAMGKIGYATSSDGYLWTDYPGNPILNITGFRPYVFKDSGLYYIYYTNETAPRHFMQRTSTNGYNWTAENSTDLGVGAGGSWDDFVIGNICVWIEGVNWYALYEANGGGGTTWATGLATSSNGINWIKYPANPVIAPSTTSPSAGGPDIHKYGDTYYLIIHGVRNALLAALPTDIYLMQSTDLIHWIPNAFYGQLTRNINLPLELSQVADAYYISADGKNLLFFSGVKAQGVPQECQIFVAESDYTLEQIATGEVLQWSKGWLREGTNNITADHSRYYHSGTNAMMGTPFNDWDVSFASGTVNITIDVWNASANTTVARFTAEASDPTASVTFTLSGMDSEKGYRVYVDGVQIYERLSGLTTLTFTYSGPWSEHTFEVKAWDLTPAHGLWASFTYAISGLKVEFRDTTYAQPVSVIWNFGDGWGSTNPYPTHRYANSGTYLVSMTAYDEYGHSNTAMTTIEVDLGPGTPFEKTEIGWRIRLTDETVIGVSATGLGIFGATMIVSTFILKEIPILTRKGRWLIGGLCILVSAYFFIFVKGIIEIGVFG